MSVKVYENGAWRDASFVRRFNGSSWVDVGYGKRYENANWIDVWNPMEKLSVYAQSAEPSKKTGIWIQTPIAYNSVVVDNFPYSVEG